MSSCFTEDEADNRTAMSHCCQRHKQRLCNNLLHVYEIAYQKNEYPDFGYSVYTRLLPLCTAPPLNLPFCMAWPGYKARMCTSACTVNENLT